jgi:4-amino-4-deoxy-L-arabinose transferase-like glycosyltransferase
MNRRWEGERWIIIAILVLYLGLGVVYSLVVPAFEAPDEPAHLGYVRYLVVHRRFPVQQPDPDLSPTLEAHQPPLYYLLAAGFTAWIEQADFEFSPPNPCVQWSPDLPGQRHVYLHSDDESFPYRDGWLALHLVRGLSVLLGGVTVWTTYRLGRTVWPDQGGFALAAAAVVAFIPQFLFIHSTVNNDNLATALSAVVLLVAVRAVESSPNFKHAALLGLLLGLGALTKYSVLALAPVALVGALVPPVRERRWRQVILHLALLSLIPVLVAGWWAVRNWHLYDDPWAWQISLASHPHDVRTEPLAWADGQLFVARVFASFWGYFGWLTVRLSPLVYVVLALISVTGAIGLVMALRRPRAPVFVALLAVVSVTASLGRYILTYNHTAYQGRFLFPSVPAIAVLFILGWTRLVGEHRSTWLLIAVIVGGLVLNSIGMWAILSTYPRPDLYETATLATLTQPCIVLDKSVQLLAYDVTPRIVRSGETLHLVFHWFGLDDAPPGSHLAIQMLGRNGHLLAEATLVPHLRLNQVSKDKVSLPIDDTTQPTRGRLQLRFLDSAGRAYPVATRNRHPLGHLFEMETLSPVKVVPAQLPHYVLQEIVGARLGEAITLLGYDLPVSQLAPGEVLPLTLYWRAEASPGDDYVVFVHLMDELDQPVAQADGPPDKGNYPTTMWEAGEQIKDEHPISIGGDVSPGRYRLGVGLYRPATGERISAFDALGNPLPAETVVLTHVYVSGP